MRHLPVALAVVAIVVASGSLRAADPRFPDWPCNQIKVPELSVAAVWAGPPIDDVGTAWEDDPAVKDLVARLATRRTPLEEARTAIADFITGAPAEREHKAKLIFTGLFGSLDRERGEVMRGIERYARKQKEFASQIRATALELRQLQGQLDQDQRKVDELASRIEWDTRVFEERRKTIGFVCEVPVQIERRLFALARAIQHSLE